MTHSHGQKVEGQGQKVMRRSSTKTSNISSKHHSVVEKCICLIGNRGRRREWRGDIFDRKFINSRFCTCAVKICSKLAYSVVKSPQCQSFYKKSWSLNTMVRAVFRPEAELTLFLRMRSEKQAQNRLLCCQIAKILAPLWAIAVAEHDGI